MKECRKVAFVCHPYHRGGVTTWMLDAAIAASSYGYTVFFVTVDPVKPFHSGRDREKMADMLSGNKDITLVSAKVDFRFEFGTEDTRAIIYADLIKNNLPRGVPLIISDDAAIWKATASIADRYPMIGVLHGNNDGYYTLAATYQRQLSVCACVSNRIKQATANRCPELDRSRLHTIPCGINIPVFEPSQAEGDLLRLIFIGRLMDYEKRTEDLVKVGTLLKKQGISFRLDIVGNNDNTAKEFTVLCKQAGIDDHVSFHGWRSKDEIQKLLNKSDLLLLTSNSEGMPLAMMEALASGCGFTGTRVSGIEDYEFHPLSANCVSVYTVGDVEDAVSKIKKIADIPFPIRSRAARTLAEAEFSMAACLEKYVHAIDSIGESEITAQEMRSSRSQSLYSNAIAIIRYLKVSVIR